MGDFNKNPKRPFEIRVPNKIRKRIAMHETKDSQLWKFIRSTIRVSGGGNKIYHSPTPAPKIRGSLWSRFTSGVANILQIKPSGVRK